MLEDIFNLQTEEEKASYTWEFGTFMASRVQGNYLINMYFVDNFFVEVWYYPEQKKVYGIKSFDSTRCYEPYLEDIKIKF